MNVRVLLIKLNLGETLGIHVEHRFRSLFVLRSGILKRYLSQRMKLRLLRSVATVATQGSLLKASQVLGLSQPALTKNLREIEDIVGVRLFDRHARGVHPNAYGTLLADAAQKILNILSDLDEGFDRIDCHVGGTVLVGALPTAASGVIPGVIRQLRASDPDIVIRVVEDRATELCAALAIGDIDVVIGRLYSTPEQSTQFEYVTLYDEPMSFIVGSQHPLAGKEQVDIQDLAAYEMSLPAVSLRVRADTQAYLSTYGVECQDEFATTSMLLQREMLFTSNIIAVMPWLILRGDIERGTLATLKLNSDKTPPSRPAGILFRRDRSLSAATNRFISVFSEYARMTLPQYS